MNPRPNILLIVLDDMGREQLSIYGLGNADPGQASTPNIDALATNGIIFDRFYVTPFCSPTRWALMTSQFACRSGGGNLIDNDLVQPMPLSAYTLPEVIRDLGMGYSSGLFGKWHLGNPLDGGPKSANKAGWDTACFTVRNLNADVGIFAGVFPEEEKHWRAYYNFEYVVNGENRVNYGEYSSRFIVDRASAWIQAQGRSPWFAYVCLHAPHAPYHRPPTIEDGNAIVDSFDRDVWICPTVQPEAQSGTPGLIAPFKASQEAADAEIGRLLASIPPAVLGNTIIMVMADNGTSSEALVFEHYPNTPPYAGQAYQGNHGKRTCFDPGVRCPLIISSGQWVIAPGRIVTGLISIVDLAPTILRLMAGDNRYERMYANKGIIIDGMSLHENLTTDPTEETPRTWTFSEIFGPDNIPNTGDQQGHRASIHKRYKLYYRQTTFPDGIPEFYDLAADPREVNNLTPGGSTAGLNAAQLAQFNQLYAEIVNLYSTVEL